MGYTLDVIVSQVAFNYKWEIVPEEIDIDKYRAEISARIEKAVAEAIPKPSECPQGIEIFQL